MAAVCPDKSGEVFSRSGQHFRVMTADKVQPLGVRVTDNNLFRFFQPHTLQRAQPGRPCSQNQHGVFRPDLRDFRRPVSGRQQVADKQRLPVGHSVGNPVQSLVGMGDPDIFRLTAVNPAAECPTAVRVGAVVDPSVFAEETFSAEGFNVDGDPVTRPDGGDFWSDLLDDADHLMTDGDARDGAGDRAVLDMQVTGADAGEGYFDDCVPLVKQDRFWFFAEFKFSGCGIGVGKHKVSSFYVEVKNYPVYSLARIFPFSNARRENGCFFIGRAHKNEG